MAGENMTGRYRVRALRPAFDDVSRLVRKTKEKLEIRRHALKLRFWPRPQEGETDGGTVVDLDWSWVRALPNLRVGELRIHDTIGGNDNLRIIFYEGEQVAQDAMPTMWVLRVLQKKRDDFSAHDLTIFKARRTLVLERFYKPRSD